MSDAEQASTVPAAPTSPKKSKAGAPKKPRAKPSHPKTADMVNAAIKDLKERGGSSLQAIKKYISVNYTVDADKIAPLIRKYLKSAVTSGSLVQTKGKGASGSFKLSTTGSAAEKKAVKAAKPKSPKPKKAKPSTKKPQPASTVEKKKMKKAPAAKKSPSPKKAKPASPSKSKSGAKSPTKKPKAPKPKKVMQKTKTTPKKTAAKKK